MTDPIQWLTLGICAWIWNDQNPYLPKAILAFVALLAGLTFGLKGLLA